MIRKLRHKFIIILMTVVALILLAVFLSVLLSTWGNIRRMSEATLIQSLALPHPQTPLRGGDARGPGLQPGPPKARTSVLVAGLDSDGNILILTNQLHFIEQDEAEAIVRSAMRSAKETGSLRDEGLRWMKSKDGTRIAFADISTEEEMLRNLIATSLLVGGAALTLFFFISLLLSRWAVRPVELAWERQRQFVADASHELKTPLTVILSNADMLCADRPFTDEKKARRIGHIQAEAMYMKKLVEDMLTLAKSDSAEKQLVLDRVDFSDIVTNAVLTFEPIIFDAQQKLVYDVQSGLFVDGDGQRLQQLVHILLDNACKYAPVNGIIEVLLNPSEHQTAVLIVKNDGDAIPKEELERIFLRFYRLDSARSSPGSFGLGLSIAESIVREHGGKIWAESDAEMKNCFSISLPLRAV